MSSSESEFASRYAAMSLPELVQLEGEGGLRPDAAEALAAELTRRNASPDDVARIRAAQEAAKTPPLKTDIKRGLRMLGLGALLAAAGSLAAVLAQLAGTPKSWAILPGSIVMWLIYKAWSRRKAG